MHRYGNYNKGNNNVMRNIIICIVIIINVITLIVYGIDKFKARKGFWRISEQMLLSLATFGGSIGAWLGMKVWHHKTMHVKFKYGIPLIFAIHISILLYTTYFLSK